MPSPNGSSHSRISIDKYTKKIHAVPLGRVADMLVAEAIDSLRAKSLDACM